jgi:hypothetical protein
MRFTSLIFAVLLAGVFMAQKTTPPTTHTTIPGSNWVNVRDYGALGSGGDDAPGFVAAINAASHGQPHGGGTVYCPSTGSGYNSYNFPHGITLPNLGNAWVEIYLDCNITIGGPIVMNAVSGYYIHGHNAGQGSNFGTVGTSQIYAKDGVNPAFQIVTFGSRLENLTVSVASGDGIVIRSASWLGVGGSSGVVLKEVHAVTRNSNATGSPLHIIDGYYYDIDGGGYEVQPAGNNPSILMEGSAPACVGMGMIQMNRVYIGNRGITINSPCNYIQNIHITQPFYEMGQTALVNLKGTWPGIISGIKLEDCAIADSSAAAMDNHAARVFGVKIDECPVTGGVLTTGNPIGMLTIWYPAEPAIPPSPGFGGTSAPKPPKIAQTRNYELHFGDRIINTIPVLNVDKFDVQSGFVQHANPPN